MWQTMGWVGCAAAVRVTRGTKFNLPPRQEPQISSGISPHLSIRNCFLTATFNASGMLHHHDDSYEQANILLTLFFSFN